MAFTEQELLGIQVDIGTSIKMIKEHSATYKSRIHFALLGASLVNTIIKRIRSISYSTKSLNGFFIMPDEIDPVKLAALIISKSDWTLATDDILPCVAYYLKKAINSFYKDLKNDSVTIGKYIVKNKQRSKEYFAKCSERVSNGVKYLRSK